MRNRFLWCLLSIFVFLLCVYGTRNRVIFWLRSVGEVFKISDLGCRDGLSIPCLPQIFVFSEFGVLVNPIGSPDAVTEEVGVNTPGLNQSPGLREIAVSCGGDKKIRGVNCWRLYEIVGAEAEYNAFSIEIGAHSKSRVFDFVGYGFETSILSKEDGQFKFQREIPFSVEDGQLLFIEDLFKRVLVARESGVDRQGLKFSGTETLSSAERITVFTSVPKNSSVFLGDMISRLETKGTDGVSFKYKVLVPKGKVKTRLIVGVGVDEKDLSGLVVQRTRVALLPEFRMYLVSAFNSLLIRTLDGNKAKCRRADSCETEFKETFLSSP